MNNHQFRSRFAPLISLVLIGLLTSGAWAFDDMPFNRDYDVTLEQCPVPPNRRPYDGPHGGDVEIPDVSELGPHDLIIEGLIGFHNGENFEGGDSMIIEIRYYTAPVGQNDNGFRVEKILTDRCGYFKHFIHRVIPQSEGVWVYAHTENGKVKVEDNDTFFQDVYKWTLFEGTKGPNDLTLFLGRSTVTGNEGRRAIIAHNAITRSWRMAAQESGFYLEPPKIKVTLNNDQFRYDSDLGTGNIDLNIDPSYTEDLFRENAVHLHAYAILEDEFKYDVGDFGECALNNDCNRERLWDHRSKRDAFFYGFATWYRAMVHHKMQTLDNLVYPLGTQLIDRVENPNKYTTDISNPASMAGRVAALFWDLTDENENESRTEFLEDNDQFSMPLIQFLMIMEQGRWDHNGVISTYDTDADAFLDSLGTDMSGYRAVFGIDDIAWKNYFPY